MKKSGLTWLLLCIVYIIQAQTITIRDKISNDPLEYVLLEEKNSSVRIITDVYGQADISKYKQANTIRISRIGYRSIDISYQEIEKQNFTIYLQLIEITIEEVVVSANRWNQYSKNIPEKVSVIRSRDARLINPQTAADLLGASGEVFIQKSQQGGGSPMIRGFSSNRLLYSIDGVRMNSAIFRSGNLQNIISLDPFIIQKTEILFGPGSILYGSDAIGGVMSFQTILPQFSSDSSSTKFGGSGSLRYSSVNNEVTGNATFSFGKKRFASFTSVSHSNFGDLTMGKNGKHIYNRPFYVERIAGKDSMITNSNPLVQIPTGYSQLNITQKFRWDAGKNWELQLSTLYSTTSNFSRYDRLIETETSGVAKYAVWNYGPQVWMMNHLSALYRKKNTWFNNMMIRFAHQYFEESRIDRGFNQFRLRTNLEKVNAYSLNIDFEKKMDKQSLYYGTEIVTNRVNSVGSATDIRNGANILVPDRYPKSTWESYAGFINYEKQLSDRVNIQAGGRWNLYKINADFTRLLNFYPFSFTSAQLQNSAFTFSGGIVYRPSNRLKLSLQANSGFRAPNVDDMGKLFDFITGEVIVPNPQLNAEYAYNIEGGVTKVWSNRVKFEVSIYYTRLQNAMVRRPYQVNGKDSMLYNGIMSKIYAIQNAAYSKVYGYNAGIEIILNPQMSLLAKYNFQKGTEEMPNGEISPSRHAAPGFGTIRYSYLQKKLSLQVNCHFSGEVSYQNLNPEERGKVFIYAKDANGNPYSPGWYTIHVKSSYQCTPKFSISGGIENITNQCYRTYSSGIAAGGLNIMVAMNVKL
jgi:hemoglobin/transferrin/lactoferrin receptor protein